MAMTPEQAMYAGGSFMVVALWCALAGDAMAACVVAMPAVALFAEIAGMFR